MIVQAIHAASNNSPMQTEKQPITPAVLLSCHRLTSATSLAIVVGSMHARGGKDHRRLRDIDTRLQTERRRNSTSAIGGSGGLPLLMANHLLANFARRDGPDTGRQGESPGQSPKRPGGPKAPNAGHIMIEEAQEERFSDVVAIAYSVLALLLMLVWMHVPA